LRARRSRSSKELGFDDLARVNPNGGACALGHPVGASGARLVGTTALEMRRRGVALGLATICGGMGQGAATILEIE
jgi:acetyl-CoA acyltransferase